MVRKKNKKSEFSKKAAGLVGWRTLVSESISLQIDLDKGQVSSNEKTGINHLLHFDAKNLSRLINDYVDPGDIEHVLQSLQQAKKGKESPITFNFIHPNSSRKHSFEYNYEIVYVKYASTCLKGSLKKVSPKPRPLR